MQHFHMKHSPMIHSMSMAAFVQYDKYLECSDGERDSICDDEYPAELWKLRDVFSSQMLK